MTIARASALPAGLAPRALAHDAAAAYLGIGASLFDRLMTEGVVPKPKRLAGRKVWDVRALDRAFDALPDEGDANPWDEP